MTALSNATIGGIAIVQIKFPEGSADDNSYFRGKDGDDNQVKEETMQNQRVKKILQRWHKTPPS